jgi:hypothetical protein
VLLGSNGDSGTSRIWRVGLTGVDGLCGGLWVGLWMNVSLVADFEVSALIGEYFRFSDVAGLILVLITFGGSDCVSRRAATESGLNVVRKDFSNRSSSSTSVKSASSPSKLEGGSNSSWSSIFEGEVDFDLIFCFTVIHHSCHSLHFSAFLLSSVCKIVICRFASLYN